MRSRCAVLALLALTACGGGGAGGGGPTVFAAASLTEVLEELAPNARFNFGGSDELATQLREGADADVYASADAEHALDLYREGIVEQPRLLAANQVVLIVPRSTRRQVRSLADVAAPGTRIVIGAPGVPAGDYARRVLELSPAGRRALANVVSEEHDVKAVVAKVALGEADAGFAYRTDVMAARDDVVEVGVALARAEYAIAVVRDGDREAGEAFLKTVFAPEGRRAFLRAGFVTTGEDGKPIS